MNVLQVLGNIITKKPWFVVLFILLITIGFSILLPSLEMKTSMEDFLPDDELVVANERINEYFGDTSEAIMVLVEKDSAASVVSPKALQEIYAVSKAVTSIDYVEETMSIAGFVDMICGMEYNKTLENCTIDEVQSAYNDLMSNTTTHAITIHGTDDPNEEIDFQRNRLSKKASIDTMDVKNLEITQNETTMTFTILLYDVDDIESLLMSRGLKINVLEWFVDFNNIIGPKEMQEMKYTIAAHIEPSDELWEIGRGPINNLNHLFQLIRNRQLKNYYKTNAVLWFKPPGEDITFPINLETGNVTWNTDKDSISISVSRKELGDYGVAFETTGFGMPARIGNISCGVRTYQFPFLQMPWKRVTINMSFIVNRIDTWQTRPLIGSIMDKILTNTMGMSITDLTEIMGSSNDSMNMMDSYSLLQNSKLWIITDRAPDAGVMSETIYIKPRFLTDIKESVVNFLSTDYTFEHGAKAGLILININGSVNLSQLETISREVVEQLSNLDDKQNAVTFHATGNSIIEYEINEVTMDANVVIVPLIFVVICIVLFISFRKLSYVVLPLLGLTFAIIWTFGTMVIFNMPFIIMEVALIPMLMGLGVDYSVHLYHNYRVERGKGLNPKKAMNKSIEDIGMAMLLATITTFIAFLSFLTATMIPLRDFGILCAIGIAYVFAITLTFQAAMRFIIDQRKNNNNYYKGTEKKKEYGAIMRKIARFVCKHPVPIVLTTVIITVGLTYGAFQVETGFSMEDFLPEENPSVVVLNQIMDEFPFASQEREYVLLEGDSVATVATLNGIGTIIDNLYDDDFVLFNRDGTPKTGSVKSVIIKAVEQNNSLIDQYSLNKQYIPKSDSLVKDLFDYLYDHDSYSYEMKTYLHKNKQNQYDATVIQVFTNSYADNGGDMSNVMAHLYEGLQEDIEGVYSEITVTVTGENSMMHVIMNSMTESQLISTMLCLILAAIVLIIAYRNPVLGLITMIPVSVSTLWIVGAMYYIGYSLNVMTIMITSLTIGLGITYAIHAVERFRLVAERTGDVISAVSETIGHTGGALLISAVTTILGFGMLALVPMPVEQQFGLITALTILFAFLTSIFILPPALLFWGRYRKKHKGYIISPGDPNKKKKLF